MVTTVRIVFLFFLLTLTPGCGTSRPPALQPPTFDPLAVAEAVFKRCDIDADGELSPEEQSAVPAVSTLTSELSPDTDGSLSKEKLIAWLDRVKESRVAITSLSVAVQKNGRPVTNARVRLTPDTAMGNAFTIAEGVTKSSGIATMSAVGSDIPGVNCGLYDISIELPGETVDRPNGKSTGFGVAVGAGLPSGYQAVVDLTGG